MFVIEYKHLIWSLIPLWVVAQNGNLSVYNDTESSAALMKLTNGTKNNISQFSLADYQQMIYRNKTTCDIVSSIPQPHDDLRYRICMCDEKCSLYNDCCPDANYHNENKSHFSCTPTFLDGYIYMKETCDSSWDTESILNYCTANEKDFTEDDKGIFQRIPVTSKISNITYKNFFCALCNNEKNFSFWEVAFTSKLESNLPGWNDGVLPCDQDFRVDFDHELIGNFNVNATLPNYLRSRIRYCVADVAKSCMNNNDDKEKSSICSTYPSYVNANDTTCSDPDCLKRTSSNGMKCRSIIDTVKGELKMVIIRVKNLPFFHYCAQIPSDNSASNLLCQKNDTSSESADLTYIDSCFLQTLDGKSCLINSFFQSNEFVVLDDESVFVYKFNSNFSSSEWEFESNTSIYLCGTEIPQTPTERWFASLNSAVSTILISISVVFLILYVILYVTNEKMRNPFGRVIFCYSLTLTATYAVFLVSDYLSSCKVTAAILHYLFLSCFSWLVVASYDCWRTVTASVTLRNQENNTWWRFFYYCLVGWLTPISVISFSVYFELSPVQSVACPLKPGYGRLNQCFIAQLLPAKYFFLYPSTFMFLIMIYFFLHITIYVTCNASTHRNFCIFSKLALVTGIPWTIGLLVTLTNGLIIRLIYCVLNSSQGIFIFFALAYDREVIKSKLLGIYGSFCKKSDANENGKVTFTKTIIKPTSQTTMNEYF